MLFVAERVVFFHSLIFIGARDHENNTHVNGRVEGVPECGWSASDSCISRMLHAFSVYGHVRVRCRVTKFHLEVSTNRLSRSVLDGR